MPNRSLILLTLPTLLSGLVACRSPAPEDEPEPSPQRIENIELALALAAVPEPFALAQNSGRTLRFRAPGPAGDGHLDFTVGPVETAGLNLVEAVRQKRTEFEQAEGGEYYGNRELGTPIGTAFTARGAYDTDEGRIEENWIYALHPGENRILMLRYRYPDGEGQERIGPLMEIMGEVEGLASPEPAPGE